MSCEEFSDQMDVLLNSMSMNASFGEGSNKALDVSLDEYEKSVYLTRAQEQLVISLYNGKNTSGDTFEGTEELRRYLSNIVKEKSLKPIANSTGLLLGMGSNSKFFTLPEDTWFITYESVNVDGLNCSSLNPMDVYPVTQDDYHKTKRNPFRGANDRRALRLDLADGVVEIICKYNVTSYYLRYLRRPQPIVLTDLSDGLSIEGKSSRSECELHEALHQRILELACALALQGRARRTSKSDD